MKIDDINLESLDKIDDILEMFISALQYLENCYDYIGHKKLESYIEAKAKLWYIFKVLVKEREKNENHNTR